MTRRGQLTHLGSMPWEGYVSRQAPSVGAATQSCQEPWEAAWDTVVRSCPLSSREGARVSGHHVPSVINGGVNSLHSGFSCLSPDFAPGARKQAAKR